MTPRFTRRRSVLAAAIAARLRRRAPPTPQRQQPLRVILPVGAGSGVDTHHARRAARRCPRRSAASRS